MPRFSARTGFFYDDELAPDDSVFISDDERDALVFAANHRGCKIKVDEHGKPYAEEVITISSRCANRSSEINRAYNQAAEKALAEYPSIERLGWDEQIRAVEKFDADPEAENILLDMLASGNGRTRAEQAASIKAARQRYLNLYGALTAMRHTMDRQVKQAASLPTEQAIAALNAIDVSAFAVLVEGAQ